MEDGDASRHAVGVVGVVVAGALFWVVMAVVVGEVGEVVVVVVGGGGGPWWWGEVEVGCHVATMPWCTVRGIRGGGGGV